MGERINSLRKEENSDRKNICVNKILFIDYGHIIESNGGLL